MDAAAFEAQVRREGYDDVEKKQGAPNFSTQPHTHPFDVRGFVLSGEFILTRDGSPRSYRAGDTFAMDAGCLHAESFGAEGSTYIVSRRHQAPKS